MSNDWLSSPHENQAGYYEQVDCYDPRIQFNHESHPVHHPTRLYGYSSLAGALGQSLVEQCPPNVSSLPDLDPFPTYPHHPSYHDVGYSQSPPISYEQSLQWNAPTTPPVSSYSSLSDALRPVHPLFAPSRPLALTGRRITFRSKESTMDGVSLQEVMDRGDRAQVECGDEQVLQVNRMPIMVRWQCPGYEHDPFSRRVFAKSRVTRSFILKEMGDMVLDFYDNLTSMPTTPLLQGVQCST
ncbi:hypothetical protein JAAARDRAFT_40915 [Jaapia argillacea MUCL 33604]|uniref:Uncharacterized protein n=1 Tax=Jaapia argillacea MUCL 33604 TaxID=933084 RepID=A0A067P9T0_9AGAM|nr:hypothetical protein JAAARDRAFT_40915 [Jaapia argillacea MUCL 33604]